MTLESLQQSFWQAMRQPGLSADSLAPGFRGDVRLSALDRVLVYRRAYWARQLEALRDEFGRLAARIGESEFSDLMQAYLIAFPSRDPRIEWIGRDLPAFLRAHPSAQRRGLADLAAFEWAEVEALLAEDAPEITTAFEVPATLFPLCRFAMVPALRVVALATEPLGEPGAGAPGSTAFAIWRLRFSVQHRRLAPDEQQAAIAALAGETVADVCEAFRDRADAAERAAAVFCSWLSDGWVSRLVRPTGIAPP
jgi:hypothetical protein